MGRKSFVGFDGLQHLECQPHWGCIFQDRAEAATQGNGKRKDVLCISRNSSSAGVTRRLQRRRGNQL